MESTPSRLCIVCGLEKPANTFLPQKRNCRDCRKVYMDKWRTAAKLDPVKLARMEAHATAGLRVAIPAFKRCPGCKEDKPSSKFGRHKCNGTDGLNPRCNECLNIEVCRRPKKDRYEYHKRWREEKMADPAYREKLRLRTRNHLRRYRQDKANQEKLRARYIAKTAIRAGKIPKPETCGFCHQVQVPRLLHAHHPDYTRPLHVVWLCARCHSRLHGPEKRRVA